MVWPKLLKAACFVCAGLLVHVLWHTRPSQLNVTSGTELTEEEPLLHNFRDLASAHPSIRPCRLLRSGSPDDCPAAGVRMLTDDMKVRTHLDLRTSMEVKKCSAMHIAFSRGADGRKRLSGRHFALVDSKTKLRDLLRRKGCIWACHLCCLGCCFCQYTEAKRRMVLNALHVDTDTEQPAAFQPGDNEADVLLQSYKEMLRSPNMVRVLRAAADPENQPLLFSCSAGKDRTGTVAALLELALGLPRPAIVADYVASTGARKALEKMISSHLGPADTPRKQQEMEPLLASDSRTIEALLDHLDTAYGGPDAYFNSIGFTKEERTAFQAACLLTR
eukprot:gnl/TRDRNA2_/TRDRNA2_58192_c0_seq1.p1 gnl/TRDRNA2_/TRDRNA2_58192_c0~~gnl/TRDRNA2_/TRDRNA2_58192_c0_seq1.p1  ORF type:complete len:333 (-),score=61.31 gnl/TRDRNA2_/TRDRNA2_58192_c0_seq1:78-1076(-)